MANINELEIAKTGLIKVGVGSIEDILLSNSSKNLISAIISPTAVKNANLFAFDSSIFDQNNSVSNATGTGTGSSTVSADASLFPLLEDITYTQEIYYENGVAKAKIIFKVKDSSGGAATGVDVRKSNPPGTGGKA